MTLKISQQRRQAGFTLVELLLVIVILGFLAGMIMPFANHQDKQTKIKQTEATFEEIRMAILGARNSFDAEGNRVIGGYVGDVGNLPKLYKFIWDADVIEDDKWTHPDDDSDTKPDTTANYDGDDKVYGDDNAQPVALWKKTLPGGYGPEVLVENGWNGPYMASPRDPFPDDSIADWESGTDEQERQFRLRECQGRLTDGWGKALIIYVEDTNDDGDLDEETSTSAGVITPLNLVFVSAGPDGRYDASNPADIDNPDLPENSDNLVLRISKNEWYSPYETKEYKTQTKLLEIKQAIIGEVPLGSNDGYTGDVLEWPKLFRWESDHWDDKKSGAPDEPYTKGQPRGLWTRTPNSDPSDSTHDSDDPPDWTQPGVGWRRAYLSAPDGEDGDQVLKDAWDREILFFKDDTNDYLILLSRGADGKFTFGSVDSDSEEPTDFTEVLDYETNYQTTGFNEDNIVEVIKEDDWKTDTALLVLKKFTVKNANTDTKAYLFYNDSMDLPDTTNPPLQSSVSPPTPWEQSDPGGLFGGAVSCQRGFRALVFWQDDSATGTSGEIDSDEDRYIYRFDIKGNSTIEIEQITVDTAWFKTEAEAPLP